MTHTSCRWLTRTLVAVGLAVLSSGVATAATYITNVTPDLDADPATILIQGSGFGQNPRVFMGIGGGAVALILLEVSQTEILAELATTTEGSYLLVVLPQGGGADLFEFTIGQMDISVDSLFTAVDSLGATVGPVIDFMEAMPPSGPVALFLYGDDKVPLLVSYNSLSAGHQMYFTELNCTGQAKVAFGLPPALPFLNSYSYGIGPGHVLYRGESVTEDGTYQSRGGSAPTEWNSPCENVSGDAGINNTMLAEPLVDLDTLFTSLFRVE